MSFLETKNSPKISTFTTNESFFSSKFVEEVPDVNFFEIFKKLTIISSVLSGGSLLLKG